MANQNMKKVQNNASNKKHKQIQNIPETKIIYLLPMIFIMAILPLIVKLRVYSTKLSQYTWFLENDTHFDFFLYYKQFFLLFAAAIMLIFTIYKTYTDKNRIKFNMIFIPLGIYALFSLLSSIASEFRNYSLRGTFEQFESVFALLSYCLIVYYAYLFINTERDLKYIIYALLISVLLLIILGLTQMTGHDFYASELGWSFISDANNLNNREAFTISAGENVSYLSLYNPNYVGVYVSIVFPIMLFLSIFTKKLWLRLIFIIATIGLLLCLYGSKSTTGFLTIGIAIVLTCIFLWRYLIKYLYISIPVILLAFIALFVVNIKADNYIGQQISKIVNTKKQTPNLTDIQTNDTNLTFVYLGDSLKVEFDIDEYGICSFNFKDQDDNIVSSTFDTPNGPVTITDPRFPGFVFTPAQINETIGFDTNIDGILRFFTNQYEDKTYYYMNNYRRFDKIVNAPSSVFTGYEPFASGRGYIWSRTFPLLKNKIFLGSGADTFTLVYPQDDYLYKDIYGFGSQILSKPHSLYLQIAVQTGVVSLIAFLLFYIIYFISSIKIYLSCKYDNFYKILGVSIFIGSIGYMICGLTNDSSITVAPLFWALIGIGIAINNKLSKLPNREK